VTTGGKQTIEELMGMQIKPYFVQILHHVNQSYTRHPYLVLALDNTGKIWAGTLVEDASTKGLSITWTYLGEYPHEV